MDDFIDATINQTALEHAVVRQIENDVAQLIEKPTNSETSIEQSTDLHFTKSERLAKWVAVTRCPGTHVNSLLQAINDPELPRDKRTLCKTPRKTGNVMIFDDPGSTYLYIGLSYNLNKFLHMYDGDFNKKDSIDLDFNIDGIGLSKSTASELWPILMSVAGYPEVYVVACHHGASKPTDMNSYFQEFVHELNILQGSGFKYLQKTYIVHIRAFICDAPARSSVLNIQGHSGYFPCHKCYIEGVHIDGRLAFPNLHSKPRSGQEFRDKVGPGHHHGGPIELDKLNIDVTTSFVIDYMHCVLLGVTKHLLKLWLSTHRQPYSLKKSSRVKLNKLHIKLSKQFPGDFSRRPRKITEYPRFKATEFRALLLYASPITLRTVLHNKYYNHFLCLHCAIRILCDPNECIKNNRVARCMLNRFVQRFKNLYGASKMTYNVHCLLHLADDVKNWDSDLDQISAFKFENYLQILKKIPKTCYRVLEQISNRIAESDHLSSMPEECIPKKTVQFNSNGNISSVVIGRSSISVKRPNNYVFFRTASRCEIIRVEQFHIVNNHTSIIGRPVKNIQQVYNNPIKSSELDIFCAERLEFSNIYFNIDVSRISKICYLALGGRHYFVKVLHF